MSKTLTLSHRRFFTKAARALVESYKQSIKLNEALNDIGIDIANYTEPAYVFLESFVSDIYDDEYGNIIDCLFALAEFSVANVGDHDVTTVEEIYDFFFKEE